MCCATCALPVVVLAVAVDRIFVDKSEHWMAVYRDGQIVREFRVALGKGGLKPKMRAGDGRVDDNDLLFAVTLRSGKPNQDLVLPDSDNTHVAAFVQDDWRVTDTFDLTVGIRYVDELTQPPLVEFMRPSFWPTTHDILTPYTQFGGPAAWKLWGLASCGKGDPIQGMAVRKPSPIVRGTNRKW